MDDGWIQTDNSVSSTAGVKACDIDEIHNIDDEEQ